MPTFAIMQTPFTEDIVQTLAEAGLTPEVIPGPVPHIICRNACSSTPKPILPMHLRARSPEEADIEATAYRNFMETLSQHYGTRPIAIPEDRWRSQNAMMKARLLAHLEIFVPLYARNCEIRRIGKQEAAAFLSDNHSYGDASCRYRYGMFLKRHTGHLAAQMQKAEDLPSKLHIAPGTLVAAAEFSNARKWTKGDKTIRSYEWVRYASAAGTRICGGMGKFLRTFISEVSPDDIMSYADIEWSEGSVYEKLGFSPEGEKASVMFRVDCRTYIRTAIRQDMQEVNNEVSAPCYYLKNCGSRKYRLKITDYQ